MTTNPSYAHCLGEETLYLEQLTSELRIKNREWESLLKFVQECVHLRCNNDQVTKVTVDYFGNRGPINYGRLTGNCLRQNTHVTHIILYFDTLIGPEQDIVDENVNALNDYIRTSPSLRSVSLLGGATPPEEALATKFLESIGRNRCIEELCCSLQSPPTALHTLLSTSSSIQKLEIECHAWTSYSLAGRLRCPPAIASSRSVVGLELSQVGHDRVMMNSIIENLTQNHSPIQTLTISTGFGRRHVSVQPTIPQPLPALTAFLQHTTTLQNITFELYNFDTDNIECLLEGLRNHFDASRTSTITNLSFYGCKFNDQAATKFARFMQSPTNGAVWLQELELEFACAEDIPVPFAEGTMGTAIVDFIRTVAVPDPGGHGRVQTIGSQLQLLSLYPFDEMDGFLTAMRSYAHEINLPKLCLNLLDNEECSQVNDILPYLRSLRELRLEAVESGVAPETILAIFRQCGNICSASVGDCSGDSFLTDPHCRILEAYRERNKVLWEMLSQKTLWSWSDDAQGSTVYCHTKKKQRCQCPVLDPSNYDRALLLPTLLQVAKQVPSTLGSSMLSAMVGFEVVDGTTS